ncbi:MAG: fibronectin type III domain-containing protein [Treponema sp.]|nr:fibronectin type III domain-containing protein [Treponema sp.]
MKNTKKGIGIDGKDAAVTNLWSLLRKLQVLKLTGMIILITSCATFGIGKSLPPPENVTLTQTVGPRSITVTWNAVKDATEYEVQIAGLGRWTTKETRFTTPSNVTVAPDRNYDVRVSANKRSIKGDQSSAVSIRTSPATPVERLPVPSNVTVTATSWNSVTITWGASAGATGYRVTQGSNTWTVTDTSQTVTNLNGNTNYSFVVTPLLNNDAGTSARSVSVRTPMSPQQQAAEEQRIREQEAAAERQRQAAAAEEARIAALTNNVNFQRLRGEWVMLQDSLFFPNDAGSDVVFSGGGGSAIRLKLQSITANEVILGDTRSGITFNYSLSGNILTITNFRMALLGSWRATDMYNGEYRRR